MTADMELNEIFVKVCEAIEHSVGISSDSIHIDDTLFGTLGIDSIDMVDILFELETTYKVSIKVSDLEKRMRVEMNDKPFDVDGVVTGEGLLQLKKYMVEVDPERLKPGLTTHQLVQLFSVKSLCKMILFKLSETRQVSSL